MRMGPLACADKGCKLDLRTAVQTAELAAYQRSRSRAAPIARGGRDQSRGFLGAGSKRRTADACEVGVGRGLKPSA